MSSQHDKFIGREHEIGLYKQWLMDSQAPKILYFCAETTDSQKKGGIGKTSLLQQCIEITKTEYRDTTIIKVDFFNLADRNAITIAQRISSQLKEAYPDCSCNAFSEMLKEYNQTISNNNEELALIRNKLSDALAADLNFLDAYLHKTHLNLLIVLDTFEVIQSNPAVAVLSTMQKFPDDYHFTHIRFLMAGRDMIDWEQPNWQGREQEVRSIPLRPFDQHEMIEYMNSRYISLEANSSQAAALVSLTSGRPILLGLVVDVVIHNILELKDILAFPDDKFQEYLVSKINKIESPINLIVLIMAHVYHRFNFALLEWILHEIRFKEPIGEVDYQRLLNILPELSFVRRSTYGGDFVLHDEMRPLVIRYCWEYLDPDKSFRRDVSRGVIKYYEELLQQERDELLCQTYVVEILYHGLFLNVDDGLNFFLRHFDKAMHLWQNAYASTLLQEVLQFQRDNRGLMSADQGSNLIMKENQLLLRNSNSKAALLSYELLYKEASKDWVEAHKPELFYGFGECYLEIPNFDQAVHWFQLALQLETERDNSEKRADILDTLGYISRRKGELSSAATRYELSIDIYKAFGNQREYAYVLNSLGNVYRQLGRTEDALIYCKRSLRIRESLFKENEGSEVAIGLSHATIGTIYLHIHEMHNAEQQFVMAREIFTRRNYKKGLASIYNRFGQVQMARRDNNAAMSSFQMAYRTAAGGIDKEAQINSLNKQGRIYTRLLRYEDAKIAFEQAIEMADRAHDFYQEAESKIDLALVLEQLGQHDLAKQVWDEGSAISTTFNFFYLKGNAERVWGDILYRGNAAQIWEDIPYLQTQYEGAFSHYVKSCHFMALYNFIEYRISLRFLADQLLKIENREEVASALRNMRKYWEEQDLKRDFPEFSKSLR